VALQLKDVMGVVAIAVRPQATFDELVETMRRFKVGAVAVIDAEGRPVGVVSEDDLRLEEPGISRGASILPSRRRHQEHEKAAGLTAREIMISPAPMVTRQTSVLEAARLMHVNRVKQLPVVDAVSGKIAGTVHQTDLLRIFARQVCDIRADSAPVIYRGPKVL
jgi:CBS domain-containing protein